MPQKTKQKTPPFLEAVGVVDDNIVAAYGDDDYDDDYTDDANDDEEDDDDDNDGDDDGDCDCDSSKTAPGVSVPSSPHPRRSRSSPAPFRRQLSIQLYTELRTSRHSLVTCVIRSRCWFQIAKSSCCCLLSSAAWWGLARLREPCTHRVAAQRKIFNPGPSTRGPSTPDLQPRTFSLDLWSYFLVSASPSSFQPATQPQTLAFSFSPLAASTTIPVFCLSDSSPSPSKHPLPSTTCPIVK